MPDYTVDVEANPASVRASRALSPDTATGSPIPTAYKGRLGGAVLAAYMDRRAGGTSAASVAIPAGFAIGDLRGHGLPTSPNVDDVYHVDCLDPDGSDANPWPTLAAIAAAIQA